MFYLIIYIKDIMNSTKKYLLNNKAFTLIELLLSLAILSILAIISFYSYSWYSVSSRDSVRLNDIKWIDSSINMFYINSYFYPSPSNSEAITYSGSVVWEQ